jgi:hypothetical protein
MKLPPSNDTDAAPAKGNSHSFSSIVSGGFINGG